MTDIPDEIREHYQHETVEDDRLNRGAGRLEFVRTQEIVRRHLPSGPLRILDVGGATGVHAAWLADEGHQVHLIDPVPDHVEHAQRLASRDRRITAEVGDARALPVADGTVDAVLLLGPLYHLTDRADRVRALSEAERVVRPGGPVFVAAISRFASLLDGLGRLYILDPEFRRIVERDLLDGQHRNPDRRPDWFTTAYFHHPDELRGEGIAAGMQVVEVLGVEGLVGSFGHLLDRWEDPAVREVVVFAARAIETEPSLLGASSHLLMVARRQRQDR